MPQQIQCRNCGGYKVESEVRYYHPTTGHPTPTLDGWWLVIWLFIGLPAIGFLYGIGFLVAESFRKSLFSNIELLGGGIAFILMVLLILANRYTKSFPKGSGYKCLLCGYQWSLKPDESNDTSFILANQQLITEGAQKLEEEETQKRLAAAAQLLNKK